MSLLQDLEKVGETLTEDLLPGPNKIRQILGAVVRFVETGSIEPVAAPTPAMSETDGEKIARLEAEVTALQHPVPAQTSGA